MSDYQFPKTTGGWVPMYIGSCPNCHAQVFSGTPHSCGMKTIVTVGGGISNVKFCDKCGGVLWGATGMVGVHPCTCAKSETLSVDRQLPKSDPETVVISRREYERLKRLETLFVRAQLEMFNEDWDDPAMGEYDEQDRKV